MNVRAPEPSQLAPDARPRVCACAILERYEPARSTDAQGRAILVSLHRAPERRAPAHLPPRPPDRLGPPRRRRLASACCSTIHKKLDRWLQFGGHCDGDANLGVAWRETVEESGMEPPTIVPRPSTSTCT